MPGIETYETVKEDILQFAVDTLAYRLKRLQDRRFVLFPWLRALLLIRKLSKLSKLVHEQSPTA